MIDMESSPSFETQLKGKQLLSWSFPEYETHERSDLWYIFFGVIVAFLIIYSIVKFNCLFAVIVILIAFILFIQNARKSGTIHFSVYQTGIQLEDNFHTYKEFSHFWIAFNPPVVKQLYLRKKGFFGQTLSIPLMDHNIMKIRKILEKNIPENVNMENESISDFLSRILKI